jgi:RNA polymerase sigma factor (sigma-70 family)
VVIRLTREEEYALVRRAAAGEQPAFERLLLDNQKNVYTLAFRMTGNEQDALDVSQDVFLKAYQSLDSFRGDSRFSVWLYRMTYNLCIDFARRQKRRPLSPLIITDRDGEVSDLEVSDLRFEPAAAYDKKEQYLALRRAVDALTPEHRQVFLLRESGDLSYGDIAAALNLSEGTVKSRLSRARRQVAKHLTAEGTFPPPARQTFRKEGS